MDKVDEVFERRVEMSLGMKTVHIPQHTAHKTYLLLEGDDVIKVGVVNVSVDPEQPL